MKKIKGIFLAILSILMIAVSCAKIDGSYYGERPPMNTKGEYAIVFDNPDPLTKAEMISTSGNGYDEFSLYTWNSNAEVIMNPFKVEATGVGTYEYDGVSGQTLQYFKNNADSYSFIGIVPTTTATLNNGTVTLGVESFVVDDARVTGTLAADSPKEFLWARADVDKANYSQVVTLPFKHANALLYVGFISDDAATEIIDYTPELPWKPGNPVTKTTLTEKRKMFDLMAEGKFVGYPLTSQQETMGGYYTGQLGNFMNLDPAHGAYNYVSKERLAELMPLVNAQFVYTDENGNVIDTDWAYGENRKDKVFMAFADGVSASDFIAGNDAFWTNLTTEEKAVMQNYHDSGCRVLRINQLANGEYFAWGESYGLYMNTTSRYFTIFNGIPGLPGIRVFSTQTDATDGYAHLAHTKTADATVGVSLSYDNRVTGTDVIQYSLPSPAIVPVGTTEADAVYSPTTFYSLPGDAGLTHFVVKVSYTYKGTTVYDVRVPLALPAAGLEAGKYYKYIINIKSTSNGTNNPEEANDEKDDVDIVDNPIRVTVDITDYVEGYTQVIVI